MSGKEALFLPPKLSVLHLGLVRSHEMTDSINTGSSRNIIHSKLYTEEEKSPSTWWFREETIGTKGLP